MTAKIVNLIRPNGKLEPLSCYDVLVNGRLIGRVTQIETTSDRHYGRIRHITGHPVEWAWRAERGGVENSPGLYGRSRDAAASNMLRAAYPEIVRRAAGRKTSGRKIVGA